MIRFDSQNNTDLFIQMQAVHIQWEYMFQLESFLRFKDDLFS